MKSQSIHFLLALTLLSMAEAITTSDGLNMGTWNTVPAGSNSIATGLRNQVSELGIAIGNDNIATNYSLVIGDASSGHWGSIIQGGLNHADENSYYVLLGGQNNNSGYSDSSAMLGMQNQLGLQTGSVALGSYNSMIFAFGQSGSGNALMGSNNIINAMVSGSPDEIVGTVLVGMGNESSATKAYAFGLGNIGQTETVTLGTYAATVSNASLIVGRGTSASARSNGLVVMKDGTVNIPSGMLLLGSEPALTSASVQSVIGGHLSANNYLKASYGTGASVTTGALLSLGNNSSSSGLNSIVIGIGAQAQAAETLAIGSESQASSERSVAIGRGSHAFGVSSQAFGSGSNAIGPSSTAIGFYSFASGSDSIALTGSKANGDFSLAAQYGVADGFGSIAIFASHAVGDNSVAISGFDENKEVGNLTEGAGSVAIGGIDNQAIGDYTLSLGYETKATASNAIALGSRNLSRGVSTGNATVWVETDRLLELGNGDPSAVSSQYSNAITTLKNGQTTLTNKAWKNRGPGVPATADPSAATTDAQGNALEVEGHTRIKGNTVIEGRTTLEGEVIIAQPQGDISMGVYQ